MDRVEPFWRCAPDGIRTRIPALVGSVLYPLSYRGTSRKLEDTVQVI